MAIDYTAERSAKLELTRIRVLHREVELIFPSPLPLSHWERDVRRIG